MHQPGIDALIQAGFQLSHFDVQPVLSISARLRSASFRQKRHFGANPPHSARISPQKRRGKQSEHQPADRRYEFPGIRRHFFPHLAAFSPPWRSLSSWPLESSSACSYRPLRTSPFRSSAVCTSAMRRLPSRDYPWMLSLAIAAFLSTSSPPLRGSRLYHGREDGPFAPLAAPRLGHDLTPLLHCRRMQFLAAGM